MAYSLLPGGLAVIWIALMSPIDVLSGQYFFMHMIQHLLLVMVAAPLLLANPMPIMLWGLPSGLRLEIGRWLRPGALILLVGLLLSACGSPSFRGSPLDPPMAVPDFQLVDEDGQPFRLSDQRGRVGLLFFG
jgi:hypothetical protein